MDAFYASVEQHRRPELRGRPVIVGGTGRRGVVAAASYEARAFGVHSAMPSVRAQRLCPQAVFLAGDHGLYGEVSRRVMAIFESITPLVEPLSLDEAFLDVTGSLRLFGDARAIAERIRALVLDREGLTCSVGIAPNKFLAKMATEQAKPSASPTGPLPGAGVAVVEPGTEVAFLRPLPVRALWGVGPATQTRLSRLGVRTIGDLERLGETTLQRALGDAHGRHLHKLAQGVDDRPVVTDQRPKSISHEETFRDDLKTHDELHVELVRMADAVAGRARHHGLPGRTVTIKVRFGDFRTITRSATVEEPVSTGTAVTRLAAQLLDAVPAADVAAGVRLLGVGLTGLAVADEDGPRQLRLDDLASDPGVDSTGAAWEAVTGAMDTVRERFGSDAVLPAALAGSGGLRAKRLGDRQWGPDAVDPADEHRADAPEVTDGNPG